MSGAGERRAGSVPSLKDEIAQRRPFRSPSQEAYLALLRTADDARRFLADFLGGHGITIQQYNVLRILRGAGPEGLPTLAVADRMVERTPGVTRLVDRMERKGWVTRERCTDDRRRVWCRITTDGLALLERIDEPIGEVDESFAEALDLEELSSLIEMLALLRLRLTGRPAGGAADEPDDGPDRPR